MKNAFTLVEVLISVFVLALGLIGIAAILATTTVVQKQALTQSRAISMSKSGIRFYLGTNTVTPTGLDLSYNVLPISQRILEGKYYYQIYTWNPSNDFGRVFCAIFDYTPISGKDLVIEKMPVLISLSQTGIVYSVPVGVKSYYVGQKMVSWCGKVHTIIKRDVGTYVLDIAIEEWELDQQLIFIQDMALWIDIEVVGKPHENDSLPGR